MDAFASLDDPLDVLLVEDDDDYADLVTHWVERNPVYATRVRRARTLAEALGQLEKGADIVLLDLTLPDEVGVRTIRQVVDATDAAVVVLTGIKDDRVGIEAIRFGVQEYLVKDTSSADTVVRAMRYAHERQVLLGQVDELQQERARERELRELERLARSRDQSVTARAYGGRDVAVSLGDRYAELKADYAAVLERMLEARAYETGYTPTADLQALGDLLGFVRATPKDVVDLHREVIRGHGSRATAQRRSALVEESRLAVLELMGHLAAYYRSRSLGRSANGSRDA